MIIFVEQYFFNGKKWKPEWVEITIEEMNKKADGDKMGWTEYTFVKAENNKMYFRQKRHATY